MTDIKEPEPTDSVVTEAEQITEAAAKQAELAVAPELVATSLPEYLRAAFARVRGGDAGVLPVIGGLIVIAILFQSLNHHFLTAVNLVNLLIQSAVYILLALGEIYALLLGEIDLSIGFVAGIGGVVVAELVKQSNGWPWWAAIAMGLLACLLIGALQGTIISRLGLPSFVVTLAGYLGWQGALLLALGKGGSLPINDKVVNDLASGNLTATASWIVMLAVVAVFSLRLWRREQRRRASGLVAPPVGLTVAKIAGVFAAGIIVVLICNTNRGRFKAVRGMPWAILIVLAIVAMWTVLLGRTKFGRYMYAVGGNAEAARRAGVNLAFIRTTAFALASFTAGAAGIIYASRLRSMSTALDGGNLVLYAVAAAVIGGTSLFGGRGKPVHAVLGGLVVGAIDNGMGLQGYSSAAQKIVTAIVLLAAVAIDSLARRGRVGR